MPIVGHSPFEIEPALLDELPFKIALLRLQIETAKIIREKGDKESLAVLDNLIIKVLTQIEITETHLSQDGERRQPRTSIRTTAL